MYLVFWHPLAMVDVKASCNTGNSAWAIVKPDILPPFSRHRLLLSGPKRKNVNFITTVMKKPNILQKTYIL